MVWYADLSPMGSFGIAGGSGLRAVGWLERGRPFDTGPVGILVYWRLVDHINAPPVSCSMGTHGCDLCLYEGEKQSNRELLIPAGDVTFMCPVLITHYMNAHGYRPPDEFCRAVLDCPPIGSAEYFEMLTASGAVPSALRSRAADGGLRDG
jgi:hypothetical protein